MSAPKKKNGLEGSAASRLNVWLNVGSTALFLIITIGGGLFALGSFTQTVKTQGDQILNQVDSKLSAVTTKVDAISAKVDSTAQVSAAKVESLQTTVNRNQADSDKFQTQVQEAFKQVFQSQRDLDAKVTQERIDRLSAQQKK